MTVTILQLMDGLEARITAANLGITFNEAIGDDMPAPAGFVELPDVENYYLTFGPTQIKYEPIRLVVLVEKQISRVGLRLLAQFAAPAGAKSILRAVAGDKTLGLAGVDANVLSWRGLSSQEVGQYGWVGGVFNVRIIAPAS